jgi:hypothetical protein
MIKSRRMKLAGYRAHTGEKVNAYTVLVRKPEGDYFEDLRIDGRLKLILRKKDLWVGFICLRPGTKGGLCEHGNKISGCIKCNKYLD